MYFGWDEAPHTGAERRQGLAACGERVARTANPGLRGAWNAQRNGGLGRGSRDLSVNSPF
jgi:hypothetical protein